MSGITLMVSGCREFQNTEFIEAKLREVLGRLDVAMVIHGGCRGTDSIAAKIAESLGYKTKAFEATFDYGSIGGPARNYVMVRESDYLLAFWRPGCDGTMDAITQARKEGLESEIVRIEGVPDFPEPF